MQKVTTIKCPECDRVWPTISEQGVHTDLYGQCYMCMIAVVVAVRDELVAAAAYPIGPFVHCVSRAPAREACVQCGSKGWAAVPKGAEKRVQLTSP